MKKLSTVVPLFLLAACSSPATIKSNETYANNENLIKLQKAQQEELAMAESTYQHVAGVYLGSKSVALRTDLSLPEAFYQMKVFSSAGSLTLTQAIAEISAKSGIPIRISNDVMVTSREPSSAAVSTIGLQNISLNATTTTKAILDQLTSDAGLSWGYSNSTGVATIQRTITRSFRIKAGLGDTTITSVTGSLGNSTAQSGSGGITTGFASNVNVVNVSRINPLESINSAVKTVLTKSGTANTTVTNSIIVTDTSDAVERAAAIIEREDEILSRNANIRVQIFSFTSNEGDSASLNIAALYKDINRFGFGIQTPTSISASGAARFSTNVLSGTGKPGHTDGSQAFFEILAQRGHVAVVHDLNVPISNLNLYALSIPRQIKYLSKTTPSAGTIAGATPGTPGLETESVTYGFKMSLLGNILDSNTIKLKFNVGILDLQLRTIDTGTGVNLQSPDLSGFEMPADLTLKPNQTAIVTGFEHVTSSYKRNGLTQDLPLGLGGGSYNAGDQKEKYYILVTPTIGGNTQ